MTLAKASRHPPKGPGAGACFTLDPRDTWLSFARIPSLLELTVTELSDAEIAADARRTMRVFLAAPSLRLTGPADGVFSLALRGRLTALRDALLDSGVSVFSAQHDDVWTTRGVGIGLRVPSAFRAMHAADLAVAYVGSPLSAGVGMELGWATALRKPVVLLVDKAVSHSPMITTLEEVSPVLPLEFDPNWTAAQLRHTIITALDWADTSLSYPESA